MKNKIEIILALFAVLFLFISCQKEGPEKLFTLLSKKETGLDFRNLIIEKENFNIFEYQYFYNGGGVAISDFNNDGLSDIVFTGNMVKNRLFVNQGDLNFEDVTENSHIADAEGWCTGVTVTDINYDGFQDIYICRAGYPFEKFRKNLLYVNQGDLTFKEEAEQYGLADAAHSTQASFFDYDNDGDLDLFLLNHSKPEYSRGNLQIHQLKNKQDPDFTNKLYERRGDRFVNVSKEAGIIGNVLSFSLGVSISDIDQDGFQDIYVANDFNEPDYFYINNGDKTFTDRLADMMDHVSLFSMGTDIADINNDMHLDVVSLDMLPESNYQQKLHLGADNYNKTESLIEDGFFYQYSRNMLQLNNGDGTFSEQGQMRGISNTDWSWSALFLDFENDGDQDLFISNGYLRDHTNMDFLQFTADEVTKVQKGQDHVDFKGYLEKMPRINEHNYIYRNNGDRFEDISKELGLDGGSVSQGTAYGDLDNDGDLDIVVNNSEDYAFLLKNNSESILNHHFISIGLVGDEKNKSGIGSKIRVYAGDDTYYREANYVRGFQSTMDDKIIIGLGDHSLIDSVSVTWPDGTRNLILNPNIDGRLIIEKNKAFPSTEKLAKQSDRLFLKDDVDLFKHKEQKFSDFDIQSLIPFFMSRSGPALASADLDNDGLDDLICGGGHGQATQIYLGRKNGATEVLKESILGEVTSISVTDVDGDHDLDIILGHGSTELWDRPHLQKDQIYLNDGKGRFDLFSNYSDSSPIHTSCIKPYDVDGDGDQDLFIGSRVKNGSYPLADASRLMLNQGGGIFEEDQSQPILSELGMVTDAEWINVDSDAEMELVVVGEWMPITVLDIQNGKFQNVTSTYIDNDISGFWNTISTADIDNDGDEDMILGNLGFNSQFVASDTTSMKIYYADFDMNNSIDPIICHYINDGTYPFVSKEDLIGQLPHKKKIFTYFEPYAKAGISDLLSTQELSIARTKEINELGHIIILNNEKWSISKMPLTSQVAPIYAILPLDIDQDGNVDLITGGNNRYAKVKLGKLDGNHGQVYLGDGEGGFKLIEQNKVGILENGDVRSIVESTHGNKTSIYVGINNGQIKKYTLK